MIDDLSFLDATNQADLVRRGDAAPLELVEAAIERIERVDPELHAVIRPGPSGPGAGEVSATQASV